MSTGSRFSSARHRIAEPENQEYLARFFWRIVISVGTTLTVLSVLYGAYEFLQPVTPSSTPSAVPSSQALNKEELQQVIDKLETRSVRFQELVAN